MFDLVGFGASVYHCCVAGVGFMIFGRLMFRLHLSLKSIFQKSLLYSQGDDGLNFNDVAAKRLCQD